jgi:hypothetical protein
MIIPAPFDRYEGEALPEWVDANDHMNLAYYTVLFDTPPTRCSMPLASAASIRTAPTKEHS